MKTSLSGALYFTSKLCLGILKLLFVFFPRTAYSDLLYCFQSDITFFFFKGFSLFIFLLNLLGCTVL